MADDLKAMPDAEFKALESAVSAEANRRKWDAEAAKTKRHDAHCDGLKQLMTKELLDVLMPLHERRITGKKQCTDNDRQPSFLTHNGQIELYCTRCALLELMPFPRHLPGFLWVRLIVSNQE